MADELSMFDPETFMQTQFEGSMSTKLILVPAQDWPGIIAKAVAKKTVIEGEDRAILDVQWCIEDPKCTEVTKQVKNFVNQAHFLDIKFVDNMPVIDFGEGKNISLGALREAVGQNTNKKWSPNMLVGQAGTIRIGHKPDRTDSSKIYARVTMVTSLTASAKKAA